MSNGDGEGVLLDVRGVRPDARTPIMISMITKLIELDADHQIMLVTDHEPAGLGYQIDLRKETRGRYGFDYHQRSDGAWVALLRRKPQTREDY